MCDSMPNLDDDFNFNDINLDFLESPPRAKRAATETQVHHRTVPFLSQTKLFSNEDQNQRMQPKLHNAKTKYSILELSKRIAEVDTLVNQVRKTERERDDLCKQLEEFHQSAQEVQSLYTNEKQKRIEEQEKTEELSRKCQSLDTHLTAKTLEVDQLQAQLDALKVPIEYGDLAVRYLKLVQKLDEDRALHWHEQAVVRDLQKYCKENFLKVPPTVQRSPRKRKASAAKVNTEIQCDIRVMDSIATVRKELQDQSTQTAMVTTRNQDCQHIGTTTTRSTTTSCFFKYHDVGVNCNLLDFKHVLNEMLDDMRSWSAHISPLSPIAELDTSTSESMSLEISQKQFSHSSSSGMSSSLSLPPPALPIELKTVGTCTYICNVQRHIDYMVQLPTIKCSNSRPPSRLMFETVKDENTTRSTTTTPSPLDSLSGQMPSIPNLFPNAFDELWQIFGHMLYGLLHRRIGNGIPFSNQTNAPSNITNQQEFYNWLQNLYLDIHTEDRVPIQRPDTHGVQNERIVDRAGSIITESILDQQTQNCNVSSPLNFSNAAPVKCTASMQYLFKPKAQRRGNQAIDEESTTDCTERHSVGTSPIRCIVSPLTFPEMNIIKDNEIDHLNNKSIDGPFDHSIENRTPSAFTSPKSTKKQQTKSENPVEISETAEKILELFPSVKNRSSTLQTVRKLLRKNLKNSRKKTIEKRKRKRQCKLNSNTENENAVDFIAKLSFLDNKQTSFIDGNEIQLDQTRKHMNQKQKINTMNKSSKEQTSTLKHKTHKIKLRELNRCLFGSETDDESNDEEIESNLPVKSDSINKIDEKVKKCEKVELRSPIKGIIEDSLHNQYGFQKSYTSSTTSSDNSNKLDLSRLGNEGQAHHNLDNNSCKLTNQENQSGNCLRNSKNKLKSKLNVSIHSENRKLCIKQTRFDSSAKSIAEHNEIFKPIQCKTQKRVENIQNVQSKTYDPISLNNVISTTNDDNCVEVDGSYDSLPANSYLEKEENSKNMLIASISVNICNQKIKDDIEEKQCAEYQDQSKQINKLTAEKPEKQSIQISKPIKNSIIWDEEKLRLEKDQRPHSPLQYSNEELKFNEAMYESPKSNEAETLCKSLEILSPSSNISLGSSSESRLIIISDVDDMVDLELHPILPKKRGRKRKSESSSPTKLTAINTVHTPCKRSARLLAKQKVKEEQRTELQNLVLGKYTQKRSKEEAVKYKIEEANIEKGHTIGNTCTKVQENCDVMIPVLGYFRENSDKTTPFDKEKISDKNENIEDDSLTKYSNETLSQNDFIENRSTFTEDSIESNTSQCLTSQSEQQNKPFVPINKISFSSSSPASPTPLDNMNIDDQSIKMIPLERSEYNNSNRRNKSLLYNFISSYEAHNYRSFNSPQLKDHEKAKVDLLEVHFKEHLASNNQSADASLQLVRLVFNTSQDLKIIAHALCSGLKEAPRPATTSYESLKNEAALLLNRSTPSIIHQNMTFVMSELLRQQPELAQTLLTLIESILFNVQNADTISINAALNLTDLYLLTLTLQIKPLGENPARLFIAKCLYYHKVKAIPMIYAVLCVFPTTLPHREERTYDRSDALITVIQHTLMCTTYNMENHQLFHRELLSKLRFVYHFEVYKPDFQDVLQNLVEKLRAGKLNNLKYAFAIFCKRLQPERVIRDVIQTHLIPLSNEYYSLLRQTTDYDERTAALLDCFSSVIKPFPRDISNPITVEINNYLNIFKRFLSVVERPIVQEAAVHAILRLQRFSNINCYNALDNFRPEYDLQPLTLATLRTFIHRKSLSFWKTLLTQSV